MTDQFVRSETSSVESAIQLIHKILADWNIQPNTVKDPNKNLWLLSQGSANFHIEIFKFNKGPKIGEVDCIEVCGQIMKMPQENFLPLYRRLLDLNSTSVGVYFAIRNNLVVLLCTREVEGLDYVELKTMVDEIRLFSDYWDDILIKEFGGSK